MWSQDDHRLLEALTPDAVLFVGDLGNGEIRLIKEIKEIKIPTAVVLGNHDRGNDFSGYQLKSQIDLLGEKDCSWSRKIWSSPPLVIVGARPCSAGGGYYLSPQMRAVFGPVSLSESIERIVDSSLDTPEDLPLIILAHSGPTGLGSYAHSLCGRDWKQPEIDWGDKDLELAIDKIKEARSVDLVVFGHMHHHLKRGKGVRNTFMMDEKRSIAYLNAASVPRKGVDVNEKLISHFSWVEFNDGMLTHVSHRWFCPDASIAYQEDLYNHSMNGV